MSTEVKKPVNKQKVIGWILGGSAVVGSLTYWALKKKAFGDRIVITQNIKTEITKRTMLFNVPSEFNLIVTPKVKNPANAQATLTQPYVEIRLLESDVDAFASSQISPKEFQIAPLSEISFDPIVIPIKVADLAGKVKAIITEALQNGKLGMYTKTFTYLVTGAGKVLVEKDDKTEFKF